MTNSDRKTPYEYETTNADLIRHIKQLADLNLLMPADRKLLLRTADALEAAKAQVAKATQEVAYLKAKVEMDGGPNCSMCRKDGPEGPHDRHDGRPCSYHDGTCEEAEANPALKCQCGRFVAISGAAWPADLLSAARAFERAGRSQHASCEGQCYWAEARAVFVRCGLLPER